MDIFNAQEHISCYYYEQKLKPHMEFTELAFGQTTEEFMSDCKVVFVMEGSVKLSYEEYVDKQVSQGEMLLLPQGCNCETFAEQDSRLIYFRIGNLVQLCDSYSLERLFSEESQNMYDPKILVMNDRITNFITSLKNYYDEGLRCVNFFDIKTKEFLYILRLYYPKSELMGFLFPLLKKNIEFSNFIFKNYQKIKTVKQFAELSGYSLSGFEKRFKKVFGQSAHTWIKTQKAQVIFKDISTTNKLFKDISHEYGFSSPAHFNDFCKAHFGNTPGEIRRRRFLSATID